MRLKQFTALATAWGFLFLAATASASTDGQPINLNDVTMNVQIGNESFNNIALNWQESIDETTKRPTYALSGGPIKLETTEGSFTIGSALFDPDPLLLFSANATNLTSGPLSYSFSFNTPLSPALSGNVTSHAELGVTLTDGLNDTATVQPLIGHKMLESFDLYSNGDPITKNVDIGTKFSINGGTATKTFDADSSLLCGQPCVTMSALLSFTLTGIDSVGFSGKVVQTSVVPVPGALWLFGSALFGLNGLRRKKIIA